MSDLEWTTKLCVMCAGVIDDYPMCAGCNDWDGVMTLAEYRQTYPVMFLQEYPECPVCFNDYSDCECEVLNG